MKFKTNETGMPHYNEMLNDKEYFETEKNKTFTIVMMSPLDYLMKCQKGFGYETIADLLDSRMKNYEKLLKSENKEWDMIMLDYTRGFSQEGITRAMIAFKKELELIPVMIVHRKEKYKKAWF